MTANVEFDAIISKMQGRSPLRASFLLLAIILFLLLMVIWASVTELDNVTRGDGRVVPSRDIQIVQTAETGVLQALLVTEGAVVEEGDLLMELDRTMLASQFDQEQQRAWSLTARISRLQAEFDGLEEVPFTAEIIEAIPMVVQTETVLFQARQEELAAEVKVLEGQRIQRQQQYEEGISDLETSLESVALAQEEMDMIAPLVARRAEAETTLLSIRRSVSEAAGRVVRAKAALIRLEAALSEIDDQISSLLTRFRSNVQSELSVATAELAELRTRLPALEQRVTRAELRAPVRGVVNQIHLKTVGGLAQAGEPLVEIVPLDDTLLIEGYVRPSDIAFLHLGQTVNVKITAYDSSRYGGIKGEISHIGADAIRRPDRDEQVFAVNVRTNTNILDADGAALEIVPGMVAEIAILAGQRSVMEYLTQPIVRVKDRAMRE
jgi:adhesin transport system membrane fusion protein